jgi:hypothetical protein
MSDPKNPLRLLTESGPLIAVTVAVAMLVAIVAPASAQFFPFGGFQQQPPPRQRQQQYQQPGFNDFFSPFQQRPPAEAPAAAPRVDYSRAPAPKSDKGDVTPERYVLVLGDAMADWLAYGLEDAFSEQPDMGVIRKHRTVSGLIRYSPRGEPADWAAAAKGIIAQEKADVIVVMLGLHDRTTIREPVVEKPDPAKKGDAKKGDAKPAAKQDAKPDAPATAKKPDEDAEAPPADDAADSETTTAPERTARSANGLNEFRSERWIELYKKKIEEMTAVLKTKGVPILWVGLPALRGPKATSDMLFLDSLYREVAAKTGVTYVDVWDGFVDESGRFMQRGPDFEGQPRALRTSDGVFFTKPGARKLAHYVDREIKRLLANRALPVALPSDPGTPATPDAKPGGPAPRPLAGPIVPLVASSVSSDQLLGGAGSRPASIDALAARTLIKGEPLAAPGGRADDAAWPRREVGKVDSNDVPVAAGTPADATGQGTTAAAAAAVQPPKPVKRRPRPPPVMNTETGNSAPTFPGFYTPRQAPAQTFQPQPPRPLSPRPPAPVGRAAFAPDAPAPGGFFTR